MKAILACLFVFSGLLSGEEPERAKENLACDLEVTRHDRVREGALGFGLKVTMTYQGLMQQMVSRKDTFSLTAITKDGEEISTENWGAFGERPVGLSDYHMILSGDAVSFLFGMSAWQKDEKWFLRWENSFGVSYGCTLETLDGVKLVMTYSNEAKEDLKVKGSGGAVLQVPKEQIWSGMVRSQEVPLIVKKGHSDE